MKKVGWITCVMLICVTTAALGADHELYLKSASMPFYPPIARQARIGGTVSLHFIVNERGETSDVEATSNDKLPGNKLLRDAAIANLQGWKFSPPECACRVRKEAVLVYVLRGEPASAKTPTVAVKWFLKAPVIRVEIEAAPDLTEWQP
ncbi:MAG: energy transducer TonB [Candidatus Sulfotelmatobacter sp.]